MPPPSFPFFHTAPNRSVMLRMELTLSLVLTPSNKKRNQFLYVMHTFPPAHLFIANLTVCHSQPDHDKVRVTYPTSLPHFSQSGHTFEGRPHPFLLSVGKWKTGPLSRSVATQSRMGAVVRGCKWQPFICNRNMIHCLNKFALIHHLCPGTSNHSINSQWRF